MQPNPYADDPNNRYPGEATPPAGHYPPTPPAYQGQPVAPYGQPYNQYIAPSAQARASAAREQEKQRARKYGIAKFMDFLSWVILALEMLFLLRFCLKLIGADPTNQFAAFLYDLTGFFLYPFAGIIPNREFGANGTHVLEWSTLIGMAVYGLAFSLLRLLLRIMISRPEEPSE